MSRIVIVGAGIIGLSVAYELSKRNYQVTVLDKGNAGEGCSYGNAGMLVPSHFETLAAPGVIIKALKWLADPAGPFSIRPSLFLSDPGFLIRFISHCDISHVEKHRQLLARLHLASRDLFLEWNSELGGIELETKGISMLYDSLKGEREEKALGKTAGRLGIPVEFLSRDQLEEKEPGLRMQVRGGVHYPLDAHLNPSRLMQKLRNDLSRKGVQILYNTSLDQFQKDSYRIRAIQSGNKFFEADTFILAAGVWSAGAVRSLGINLPLQSGKGYSLSFKNTDSIFKIPKLINEAKVAVTPMGGMIRFGGTMQLGDVSNRSKMKRVEGIYKAIKHYFPSFSEPGMDRAKPWFGFRPVSPDGLPYLGRLQKYPNLIVATGHSMIGLSMGPITGKLVSQIVNNEEIDIDLSALHPERFQR